MQLRLRPSIALLLGLAGAMLVWLLAPWPSYTARLPVTNPLTLHAISSDGRFLVTTTATPVAGSWRLLLWDRTHGLHEPVIERETPEGRPTVLFSPDETQIAAFYWAGGDTAKSHVFLVDIASASLRNELTKKKCEHLLFAPDGKLCYVADQVLYDMETDREIRRLPKTIDDFGLELQTGEFAIYRESGMRDKQVRVHSLFTGELISSHDLSGNFMRVTHLSRDGQVIEARGWRPGASPWSAATMSIRRDARTGVQQKRNDHVWDGRESLSPDGQHVARFVRPTRPEWLAKWWPVNNWSQIVRVTHWSSERDLATLGHGTDAVFSPQSSQFAVVREGGGIDVHEFPFRTPWGTMVVAALLTAAGSWCVGCLWGRWRHPVDQQGQDTLRQSSRAVGPA